MTREQQERPGRATRSVRQQRTVPTWTLRTLAYCGAVLAVAAVCWLLGEVLLRLWLVTFTLAVALLLTALLAPLATWLESRSAPPPVAALISLLLLVVVPIGVGFLVWTRVRHQAENLGPAVVAGIDDVRQWLITGPLSLDPSRVQELRDQLVTSLDGAVPSTMAGARTALQVLTGIALALFAVFFFLKDGRRMWGWLVERVPARRQSGFDGAGREAWRTISAYVVGLTLVALADALLIGTGLFFVGVPLWFSLSLLVFVGAYVPVLGATVSGAIAVLVTTVTNGFDDALIILVVVLVVQQIEGNLLQPLVIGHAVHIHPVVSVVAVTCGTLLLGIPGALLAVPVVAVVLRVLEFLRTRPDLQPRAAVRAEPGEEAEEEGPAHTAGAG